MRQQRLDADGSTRDQHLDQPGHAHVSSHDDTADRRYHHSNNDVPGRCFQHNGFGRPQGRSTACCLRAG